MLLKFLSRAEENIIAALMVAMTLLVFIDVVMRFGWGLRVSLVSGTDTLYCCLVCVIWDQLWAEGWCPYRC